MNAKSNLDALMVRYPAGDSAAVGLHMPRIETCSRERAGATAQLFRGNTTLTAP